MRPAAILRFLALAALLAPAAATAHQLGKLQVYATFLKDGTYRIDIPLDPSHMTAEDLGGPVGKTRYGTIAGLMPQADHEFGRLLRALVEGATVSFDGHPEEPEMAIAPRDPDGPADRVTLRFQGPIPGGAHRFVWRNTTKVGSYPLVLLNEGDESSSWQWLEGGASAPFPLSKAVVPQSRGEVLRRYFALGFSHIVPQSPDSILFVLGVFLLSWRLKPMLAQVAAFSVAQTLALVLGVQGIWRLPSTVVAALIALSIVVVAVGNIVTPRLPRSRFVLIFLFGLLYGLALAGVLSTTGPSRSGFAAGLLGFDSGVECGQLTVIGIAFLLVGLPFRKQLWYRQRVVVPASCVIAAVGLYWSVQRVFF